MSDEVNIRLVINPITRTIAPKYRNQKAVYVAKGDHNSVLINFEMPRYVDGFDMSAEGNIIHIHYANISYDKTRTLDDALWAKKSYDDEKVSRGFSDAVNVEVEGDNIIFSWLVPNTATRYAGVVSIGITFERYDTVDGKAQEVYSWSTAPYGKTIVWDSLDNTTEVTEREYDYLVETCNAIVSKTVGGMIDDIKEYYDVILAGAESVAEIKVDIDKKHKEIEESALSVSQHSQSVQTYAEEAKTARDEAKRYASAFAVNGEATGTDAVRIDDVSGASTDIEVVLTPANLINQERFLNVSNYGLSGEVGKAYTLSYKLKEGADISGVTSGIFDKYDGGMVNDNFIADGVIQEHSTSITITIEEGHTYEWNTENGNTSYIFESVSMVMADVSDVSIKTYGKNLIDYDVNTAKWEVAGNGRVFYFDAPCIATFSVQRIDNKGTIILERSTDNFVTDDTNVSQASVGKEFKPCVVIPGYQYRVYTTKATADGKLIEWMQLEVGASTEYEKYKEPVAFNGTAFYPTTTLVSDTKGVDITVKYYRDFNKVIAKLEDAIANS